MSHHPDFGRLHEALRKAGRVLLVAHKKPDGDTIGSSSSILNWLLREGKHVTAFCADLPPTTFQYIDNIHRFTNDPRVFDAAYDIVIIFDASSLSYCGVDAHIARLPSGHLLVNIDHHVTNERFAQMNLVFSDASSTVEIVHRFYEANNIFVDPRMATSLLTGLLTDTSHFSNAATTSGSMDTAAKMVASGARHLDIAHHVVHNKTIDGLRIWGLILSRLIYNPRLDIATTYILLDDIKNESGDVVEGVSNFLNAVVGQVDTLLVLKEIPNGEVRGSMRSAKRDVSKLAKLFGGGGHKKAAGFTVKGRIQITPEGPRIVG